MLIFRNNICGLIGFCDTVIDTVCVCVYKNGFVYFYINLRFVDVENNVYNLHIHREEKKIVIVDLMPIFALSYKFLFYRRIALFKLHSNL